MHSTYKDKMFKIHFWVYKVLLIPSGYIFYEMDLKTVVGSEYVDGKQFKNASSSQILKFFSYFEFDFPSLF